MVIEWIVGFLASLLTQMTKRKDAGTLENIGLAFLVTYGTVWATGLAGYSPDLTWSAITTFAAHGLIGDQKPMQQLKIGVIDKVLSGFSKAVGTISSEDGGGGTAHT